MISAALINLAGRHCWGPRGELFREAARTVEENGRPGTKVRRDPRCTRAWRNSTSVPRQFGIVGARIGDDVRRARCEGTKASTMDQKENERAGGIKGYASNRWTDRENMRQKDWTS